MITSRRSGHDFVVAVLRVGAELAPIVDQHPAEGRYVRHVTLLTLLLLVIVVAPDGRQRRSGTSCRTVNGHVRRTFRCKKLLLVMDGAISRVSGRNGRRRSRNGNGFVIDGSHSAAADGGARARDFHETTTVAVIRRRRRLE